MKSRHRRGGLFALLTRNYLFFTLTLLTISVGIYVLWAVRLNQIYLGADWSALLDDPALAEEKYDRLQFNLTGKKSAFLILNSAGAVLYSSGNAEDMSLTPSEVACVPEYGADVYVSMAEIWRDGRKQYLVTQSTYDDDGYMTMEHIMMLDADYQVLDGGFGDGRSGYTRSELDYLTGKKPAGKELFRSEFTGKQGEKLTVLLCAPRWTQEGYQEAYQNSQQIWLLFIPLYLAATGGFIWWMNRRIRHPLDRLNTAILAQAEGCPVRVGDCGGPEEIRRIGESFDRLSVRLEESEAERRRLDDGRQKLIADISHDLKTPITVIAGYADAICDGKVSPEEMEKVLRAVRTKSTSLTELINAFHEYSKIEHPEFALHLERTDLCEFSREYLAEKYDEIDLAGFVLQPDVPESSVWVRLDPFHYQRVLDNLLSNSLRHNRPGTLLFFEVCLQERAVRLTVGDNGTGIPPAKAKAIFEPFTVGDDSRSKGGSGLGLAITRRIVEKHGGSISLAMFPAPGRSTEFVVILPLSE